MKNVLFITDLWEAASRVITYIYIYIYINTVNWIISGDGKLFQHGDRFIFIKKLGHKNG